MSPIFTQSFFSVHFWRWLRSGRYSLLNLVQNTSTMCCTLLQVLTWYEPLLEGRREISCCLHPQQCVGSKWDRIMDIRGHYSQWKRVEIQSMALFSGWLFTLTVRHFSDAGRRVQGGGGIGAQCARVLYDFKMISSFLIDIIYLLTLVTAIHWRWYHNRLHPPTLVDSPTYTDKNLYLLTNKIEIVQKEQLITHILQFHIHDLRIVLFT